MRPPGLVGRGGVSRGIVTATTEKVTVLLASPPQGSSKTKGPAVAAATVQAAVPPHRSNILPSSVITTITPSSLATSKLSCTPDPETPQSAFSRRSGRQGLGGLGHWFTATGRKPWSASWYAGARETRPDAHKRAASGCVGLLLPASTASIAALPPVQPLPSPRQKPAGVGKPGFISSRCQVSDKHVPGILAQ